MNPSLLASCLAALLLANASVAQLFPPNTGSGVPATTTTALTTTSPTSTQETTTTTSSTTTSTPPTTTTSSSETSKTSQSTSNTPTTSTSALSTQSITLSTSTDTNGVPATITVTSSSSSSAPSTSSTGIPSNSDGSTGGLGVGPIIGMSVAGGIAVIGIVAFVIWKMTRKRFSDFDDNEAIKWPELNSHGNTDSHALPVHSTGRAGFETGSEASLSRVNSSNYSTPDFASGAGPDPYAIPPLPHLNPNQPYRDDPGGPAGYYDPYRGPVPGTLENGGNDWPGEAIPMTQMNASARTMSPAPSTNFVYDGGRQSPVPHLAYQGRGSPGPQVAYGGRASPGPQLAYGGANYEGNGGR
ncbi:hypothetical protein AX15_001460 [Amanita polypyramis BW_CC]|nr:hypothetical protein AX15_001460 [Amanita polypyramis BW_CC]